MAPTKQNTRKENKTNKNLNNDNVEENCLSENNNSRMTNGSGNNLNLSTTNATLTTTTGAVPKIATMSQRLATLLKEQMLQQQQQQIQQQQEHRQLQQEIERRATESAQPHFPLNNFNDYLLASRRLGQQQQEQQQLQQNQQATNDLDSISSNSHYDTESNTLETPRPLRVRPIQRVRHQQEDTQLATTKSAASSRNNAAPNNSPAYSANATVGVVIPTTPNYSSSSINESNNLPNQTTIEQQAAELLTTPSSLAGAASLAVLRNENPTTTTPTTATEDITGLTGIINDILNAPANINLQRQQFELVRAILGLDGSWNSSSQQQQQQTSSSINLDSSIPSLINQQQQLQIQQQLDTIINMVRDTIPNSNGHGDDERNIVVNSASLEDVPLSEMSDQRAQSIQSLHSFMETPTPDTTPTFEELQERLEASSRNMQNIQDKQAQLLRLQNAAKEHLSDMEKLRQQSQRLSFEQNNQDGAAGDGVATCNGGNGDIPNYQSVGEVDDDMSALVGRMKNLTKFIHNQNELTNILGLDGPEVLAEQQMLQDKLESLRKNREDMRNLVDEMEGINRTAEKRIANSALKPSTSSTSSTSRNDDWQPSSSSLDAQPASSTSRIVPIELRENATRAAEKAAMTKAALDQKNKDIDQLKQQMHRLQEMLSTVNLIEESTSRAHNGIDVDQSSRERTPVVYQDQDEDDVSSKVRALNKVTADIRAEASQLQLERDRINELKAEIERRKEQAAAAAQMGEDALKRSSLTPTPTPHRQAYDRDQAEREQLKSEYENKKREFEKLCQRLDGANGKQSNGKRRDNISEADDEADDTNDSDYSINKQTSHNASIDRQLSSSTIIDNYAAQQQQQHQTHAQQQQQQSKNHQKQRNHRRQSSNHDDDSNVAIANSTNEVGSLDAMSIQSGSTCSFFIQPPRPSADATWATSSGSALPHNWNPNYYYAIPPPPAPSSSLPMGNIPNSATNNSNDYVLPNPGGLTAPSSTTSTVPPLQYPNLTNTTDPMVLQQIVQTQQMIINSLCQTNQTLWHQQREIDAINSQFNTLQERINGVAGGVAPDIGFNLRSESVPPPTAAALTSNLQNNNYLNANRAQSEQPLQFGLGGGAGVGGAGSAFTNYQQHQQIFQQQRHHQQQQRSIFSDASQLQQQQQQQHQHVASTSAMNSVYHQAALNNVAVATTIPPPPAPSSISATQQQPTHFNNETPLSPHMSSSPGPIFMHHHNNTIHQNNANLRTQNHYANNLQQSTPVASGQATLNNQVPPGNRANNYWDNFRSYSRQNMLSINSHKSNEDQQQSMLLQQEQQQQEQQQQMQQRHFPTTATTTPLIGHPQTFDLNQSLIQTPRAAAAGAVAAGTSIMGSSTSMQQRSSNQPRVYSSDRQNLNLTAPINNLNYNNNNSNNNNNNNKYMNVMDQQALLYQQPQQQQQNQQADQHPRQQPYYLNLNAGGRSGNNGEYIDSLQRELDEQLGIRGRGTSGTLQRTCSSIIDDEHMQNVGMSGGHANNNINHNLNYGNSPLFQRNKVPTKTSASSATSIMRGPPQHQHRYEDEEFDDYELIHHPYSYHVYDYATNQATGSCSFETPPANGAPRSTITAQNYNATEHNYAQQQQLPMTLNNENDLDEYDNGIGAVATNDCNAGAGASGEINRNLLVNELKNDKFTTKFVESFRKQMMRTFLEGIIDQEPENTDQRQSGLRREAEHPLTPAAGPPTIANFSRQPSRVVNQGGCVSKDPFRKLYLNRMQQRQQQQKQHQQQHHYYQHSSIPTQSSLFEFDDSPIIEEEEDDINNAETESNKANEVDEADEHNLERVGDGAEEEEEENDDEKDEEETVSAIEVIQQQITTLNDDERKQTQNENPEDEDASVACPAVDNSDPDNIPSTSTGVGGKALNLSSLSTQIFSQMTNFMNKNNNNNKTGKSSEKKNSKRGHGVKLQLCECCGFYKEPCHHPDCLPKTKQPQQRSQIENHEQLYVDCPRPPTPPDIEIFPDYDLIEYIIKRIRNQTHPNTVINDPLLIEISKLTATAAQNSAARRLSAVSATQISLITPKRIYTKIKKSVIPRNRNDFLQWYGHLLERMFILKQHFNTCRREGVRNPKEKERVNRGPGTSKINSIRLTRSAPLNIPKPLNVNAPSQRSGGVGGDVRGHNDGDLAEADQNSSPTNIKSNTDGGINENANANTTTTNTTTSDEKVEEVTVTSGGNGDGICSTDPKCESDDFENNENPEEESASHGDVADNAIGDGIAGDTVTGACTDGGEHSGSSTDTIDDNGISKSI